MSGGGTSSTLNQNNAQNNLQFQNTGTINVGGSIGNGNTDQSSTTSSQGGGVNFSATVKVTPPTAPTAPTAPSMPGLLLMNLRTTTNNYVTDNQHNITNNTTNTTNIQNIFNHYRLT